MQVSSGLGYSMPVLKMYRRVFVHAGLSKNLVYDWRSQQFHICFGLLIPFFHLQVDEGVTKDESTWYPIFASNDIRDCEPHSSRFWNEVIFESLEKKEKS